MKRKVLSFLLVMAMGMSILAGCGSSDKDTNVDASQENELNVSQEAEKEDVKEEREEVDTSIYSEKIELTTAQGKSVWVYYDPTVVECKVWEDSSVDLGEALNVEVYDAASAKEYMDFIVSGYGGKLEVGIQEEVSLGDYTVIHYGLTNTESGKLVGDECIIELESDVVFIFRTVVTVEEGSRLDTEFNGIKFVVDGDTDKNVDTNDVEKDDSVDTNNPEMDLKTYKIPVKKMDTEGNVTFEEIGTLTYNGNLVEFINEDEFGTDFDVKIKEGKRTTIIGVNFKVVVSSSVEELYQDFKSGTGNANVVSSEVSELKETVLNEIPVQYFTCTYTMKAGNENKDFYAFVDFPFVDHREYGVQIYTPLVKEEELTLTLSGLENLLVDIELQGAKPVAMGEESTTIENTEFDKNIYNAEAVAVTSGGKTVRVYYDPNIIAEFEIVDTILAARDMNGNRCIFSVSDYASAEDYRNRAVEFYGDSAEATEIEKNQIGGHTVHEFQITTDRGELEYGVIELGSDVIFDIDYSHMDEEVNFEEVLGAMKFEVE